MTVLLHQFLVRPGLHDLAFVHDDGKGLVAAVQIVKPGTKDEPDTDATWEIVRGCVERGLMLFSPVGPGGGSVKICPPLTITEDAVKEGAAVLEEAMAAVL